MLFWFWSFCGTQLFCNFSSVEPVLRTLGGRGGDVTLLQASLFAVCGVSVKQVSHSGHVVLDTGALYTFLILHLSVYLTLGLAS